MLAARLKFFAEHAALAGEASPRLKFTFIGTGRRHPCRRSPASAPLKMANPSADAIVLGARRHRRALQIPITR